MRNTLLLQRNLDRTSPTVLVFAAIISVQIGAALAKNLFPQIGPAATVLLRTSFAAVILCLVWRPSLRGHTRSQYAVLLLYGACLAGMNLCFYAAIDRVPLGVAVTVEFVGPLTVAVIGSRRPLDLLWVTLAGIGILLLSPIGDLNIDVVGILFAVLAGACWAGYIVLGSHAGREFRGATGLSLALIISSVLLLPVGVATAGARLFNPVVLLAGLGVAVLSSAIPFSLDFEALKRIPPHVFGVLTSLEPAIAAAVGIILLGERLELRAIIAIVLVTAAAMGASKFG
jgi:inner membrane transporter RhtA